jgi:hypothetical protein
MNNERSTSEFHFEEYTNVPRRTVGQLCVSIYQRGKLFFNAKAMDALGHPERIILLFDHHRLVIGVKPTYNPVPHAIPVRAFRNRYMITIAEFLRKNDVYLDYSIRFLEPYVEEDGTLILDLNRTTHVIGARTIAKQRAAAKK